MFYLLCCRDCTKNHRAIGVSIWFLNLRSLPGLYNPGEVLAAISRLKAPRSVSKVHTSCFFVSSKVQVSISTDFFSNLLQAENPSVFFLLCFHLLLFHVLDIKPRSQRPLHVAGDPVFDLRRPSEPCLEYIMQIISTIPSPGPLMAEQETARAYSSSNRSTLPSSLSSVLFR